jgi:preprotein translocase subunit YajC
MNSIALFASTSSSTSSTTGSSASMIIMLVVLFAVMYFMMIRPQKKRQKEEQEMRASLEIGDEIVTIGGIVGKVVTIRENDIIIETGSDRNKMRIERWAVNTNRTKMEQHQKEVEAARDAAKAKKADKKSKKEVVDETKNNNKD